MTIYLDYNASTPIELRVLDEMNKVYKEYYGNASSRTHVLGQRCMEMVEKSREHVANLLGVKKAEIVFTSGATESNNLAILGLAQWGKDNSKKHIISTAIEHKAVLEPLQYLEQQGFEVELVYPDESGKLNAEDIKRRVRPDTLLVSVMHVNNETGVIQPVQEIGDLLADTEVYLHIDAAQSYGKLVNELQEINYDLLSISGHKIYAPQGIGALVVKKKNYQRVPVKPILYGGDQEGGLRPGTLPVALIAGLGKASEIAGSEFEQRYKKYMEIRESILSQLNSVDYMIHGDQNNTLPSIINVSFPKVNSEALMVTLREDVAISNGSACTSKEYNPSHVLEAMGISSDLIHGAVRISWGYDMKNLDLSDLIHVVKSWQS